MRLPLVNRRRGRPLAGLHLRQVRPRDLPHVIAFCLHHGESSSGHRGSAMASLRRGHIDTIVLAWQDQDLVGVACCSVAQHRARLLELIVRPHIAGAAIERRLLRRTLLNLRLLGVESLDFSGPVSPAAASSSSFAPAA